MIGIACYVMPAFFDKEKLNDGWQGVAIVAVVIIGVFIEAGAKIVRKKTKGISFRLRLVCAVLLTCVTILHCLI